MRITDVEPIVLRLAEVDATRADGTQDSFLVRIHTDEGIVGVGEADTAPMLARTIIEMPSSHSLARGLREVLVGEDPLQIDRLWQRMFHASDHYGRRGAALHVISAIDIALWDIAGKRAGKPLHQLLGGTARSTIAAYASLLRYGDAALVAQYAARAVGEGFAAIKLHEIDETVVAAARAAVPGKVPLMFDVNCAWSPDAAQAICARLAAHAPHWIEEPVFPPEDFAALKQVRGHAGVALAAGENWCTVTQFRHALDAGAVDIVQPSVTKVGGVSEFVKVAALARERGVRVAPHSPYFGPGAIATLHLLTTLAEPAWFELYYLDAEAALFGDALKHANGVMAIPQGPGLGAEPDAEVIARFRTD